MRCPHGSGPPSTCSQCIGATPTRVEVRAGVLYVDGVENRSIADINRARFHEETEASRPYAKRTCGNCRLPGHNVLTCPNPTRSSPVGTVMRANSDEDLN